MPLEITHKDSLVSEMEYLGLNWLLIGPRELKNLNKSSNPFMEKNKIVWMRM